MQRINEILEKSKKARQDATSQAQKSVNTS